MRLGRCPTWKVHARHDADLVTVLEVPSDAGQRHPLRDALRAKYVRRADARQHQQLRGVEHATAENHLARGIGRSCLTGLDARRDVRAIQSHPLSVLDAVCATLIVEQHPSGDRVQTDRESIRIATRDVEYALPCPVAAVAIGGERQVANSRGVVFDEPPVVRIERPDKKPTQALPKIRRLTNGGEARFDDDAAQMTIGQGLDGNRRFDGQPPTPPMSRWIDAEPRQPAMDRAMPAVLETLEVPPHGGRRPAAIPGQPGDVVPVRVLRIDEDHRVVRGAAAKRASTRIENASGIATGRQRDVLGVATVQGGVGLMLNEEVPGQPIVFGRERMKRRDVVVVRQPRPRAIQPVPSGELVCVSTGFEEQHPAATFRQTRGQCSAASAGSDDDVLVRVVE
jgi:hypothetical protein